MHEVSINNTVIKIPSKWDELQRSHLELIAGLASLNSIGVKIELYLLFYIAGIQIQKTSSYPSDNPEHLYQAKLSDSSTAFLTASQLAEMCNLFDFIFKKNDPEQEQKQRQVESQLTVNLIPKFKVSGTTYYGPADKLFNITLSEFIHAETNLARYNKNKETSHLDKLIAILYRPQDNKYDPDSPTFTGDRRTPFNDHRFDERAIKFRRLSHNTRMCIYLFYQGCQWWYQQRFPHVFSTKKNGPDNNLGFLNLVDALTGGDVTKTEEIRKTYLVDVMVHLERAGIENEKMQEDLNKNKHGRV